jgi:hypothetical protein
MAFRPIHRRTLCLLTALLFGIGTVMHAYAMTGPVLEIATAAAEMAPQEHNMDCGGADKASHAACIKTCATAAAILCESAAIAPVRILQKSSTGPALPFHGRAPSPEPHPPKRIP